MFEALVSPNIFLIYFVFINVIGFIAMGIDKYKANRKLYRVPEANLFSIALAGGSIGVYSGMFVFRHKTLHRSFRYGIPIIFIITYSAVTVVLLYGEKLINMFNLY